MFTPLPCRTRSTRRCLLALSSQGFTIDGKVGSADKAESFVYKCIYVQALEKSADDPLVGFVMELKTAGEGVWRMQHGGMSQWRRSAY